jgi:transposase
VISLSPQLRVLVATEPADFRKGIDALAALCRAHLDEDPFSGAVFVFRNRRATAVKLLAYDGHGFWLCLRRFSRGRVRGWPSTAEPLSQLAAAELAVLLFQGDPRSADFLPAWRPVTPHAASSPAIAPRAPQRQGSHSEGARRTASHSRPTSVR